MPVVSDSAWLAVASRRKALRDEVRARFQENCGVKPLKTLQDMTAAPVGQIGIVNELIAKTLAKATPETSAVLAIMQSTLTETGLGMGAAGKISSTALNLESLVPQGLFGGHFLGMSWDGND
jgi:hypothetical protein